MYMYYYVDMRIGLLQEAAHCGFYGIFLIIVDIAYLLF